MALEVEGLRVPRPRRDFDTLELEAGIRMLACQNVHYSHNKSNDSWTTIPATTVMTKLLMVTVVVTM